MLAGVGLVIYLAGAGGDLATTKMVFNAGGWEGNGRYISDTRSFKQVAIRKSVGTGVVMGADFVLRKHRSKWVLRALALGYNAWAIKHNLDKTHELRQGSGAR